MRREKLQLRYRLPPERGQQLIWRQRKRRRTRSTALGLVTSRAADYSVFYWASGITPGASAVRRLQLFPLASPYAAALTSSKGRLTRCTVAALTPDRLATFRTKVGPILAVA